MSEVPLTPVVIQRSKWLHGETAKDSYLIRTGDGKMCCVGFMCIARGIDRRQLEDINTVDAIPNYAAMVKMRHGCGGFGPLYAINDVPVGSTIRPCESWHLGDLTTTPMTEARREQEIIERAKPLGVEVTFED